MYEGMKLLLTPTGQSAPSTFSLILSGGSAGVAYWTSIYPLDTIRTAIQVQEGPVRYKGMIDCAKSIFREQGMKGFYRGYILCLMRSIGF
jgi:solute carrier family 25 carnitine/acylcarnitine transporter 20/29